MIQNIQLLRFVAAYAVAAFHFAGPYGRWGNGWFGPFVLPFEEYGFIGVDVFFAISGYIMWHSTEDRHQRSDVLPFLCRRFARVFIGYWPWLAVMLWVVLFVRNKPASSVDWLNAITLWPGDAVLPTSWTLTFELLFYIAFGLLMLLPRRAAMVVLACWGGATLVVNSMAVWGGSGLLNGLPVPLNLFASPFIAEFCAGSLLAAMLKRFGVPRWWFAASICALAFIAGAMLDIHRPWTPEKSLLRIMTFGLCGVAAIATAVALEERQWRAGAAWVLLGNASYALYLAHFPILVWGRTYWQTVKAQPDLLFGSLFALTLLASLAWYVLAERPLQQASNAAIARMFRRLRDRSSPATEPVPATRIG